MLLEDSIKLLRNHKENSLFHRYINNDHILSLIKNLEQNFTIKQVGNSVNNEPIFTITVGKGSKRILMWSQMHGNESTTTKALFDVFNILKQENELSKTILEQCTLTIIPILSPDGARLYTRLNTNEVDLNRDAQNQSQPESRALLEVFEEFKPHFCFNLHGQRTIFSAGKTNNPATVSFLSPAQDVETTVTINRKQAMEVIVAMNNLLQQVIPNQVGIYDDSFNLNCVGDTFQSKNVPTILFEAGHFANDYKREQVREYIGLALLKSMDYIANNAVSGELHEPYFSIPMNEKLFFDIVIRNAKIELEGKNKDVAIQFKEVLVYEKIQFKPIIESIGNLSNYYGHIELDANSTLVSCEDGRQIFEGYENDFVLINCELFSLNVANS